MLIKLNSNNQRMPPLYIYILYGRLTLRLFFNLQQEVYRKKTAGMMGSTAHFSDFFVFYPSCTRPK